MKIELPKEYKGEFGVNILLLITFTKYASAEFELTIKRQLIYRFENTLSAADSVFSMTSTSCALETKPAS